MSHRIREAPRGEDSNPLGGEGQTVEVDETYRGDRAKKRREQGKKGRGYAHKDKVLTLVERGGRARSVHLQAVNASTRQRVDASTDRS